MQKVRIETQEKIVRNIEEILELDFVLYPGTGSNISLATLIQCFDSCFLMRCTWTPQEPIVVLAFLLLKEKIFRFSLQFFFLSNRFSLTFHFLSNAEKKKGERRRNRLSAGAGCNGFIECNGSEKKRFFFLLLKSFESGRGVMNSTVLFSLFLVD